MADIVTDAIAALKIAYEEQDESESLRLQLEAVRVFVNGYAWLNEPEEVKQRETECILWQGDWVHITALADKFAGAQWDPGPEAFADGMGFALTALYECHDGPHLPTCPRYKG